MSTRTRIVLEIDGRFMVGKEVKPALVKYGSAHIIGFRVPLPFDLEAMKTITAQLRPLYQRVGLHVFREPRRVRDVRSRYKRIVLRYGLGRRRGGSGSTRGGDMRLNATPVWRSQSLRVPTAVPEQPITRTVDWGRLRDNFVEWQNAPTQTATGIAGDLHYVTNPDNYESPRG